MHNLNTKAKKKNQFESHVTDAAVVKETISNIVDFHKLTKVPFTNLQLFETAVGKYVEGEIITCLLYTSPSPRDATLSRMPSSA